MKDSTTADAGHRETRVSGRPEAAGPGFHDASRSRLALPAAMVLSGIISVQYGAGIGAMFRPAVLATGAAIGILSSVIPYRLELEALRRMPMRLFGVWMSLEPAVAALIGLALLGQHLSLVEWLAIGCVMIACAGAASGALP